MKLKIALLTIILFSSSMFSQDDRSTFEMEVDSLNVKSQISLLLSRSKRYSNTYGMSIRRFSIVSNNIMDTISLIKKEAISYKKSILEKDNKISLLEMKAKNDSSEIVKLSSTRNEILFLGTNYDKNIFNPLLYTIVFVLLIGLIILSVFYRKSYVITNQVTNAFREIEEEFEEYKYKSLDRERKLMRKLQDEINKKN